MDKSFNVTALAISHFLSSPLYHRVHLCPPHCTILCRFHPFSANTLCHCLLPSPHHEATSMTLRSTVLPSISATSPCFLSMKMRLPFHFSGPFLSHAPHDRTTRSSWRSTFHRHAEVCVLPDSCAVVLTTVSCVLQLFQWAVLVHMSLFSASCLVLPAG